jgi:nicotinamide-nucleotide amidase
VKKVYNAEIISVGTELLLGQITNTDSRDISTMLSKIGINVLYHTVVGDNPQRMEKCIEIARSRVDIIITTGGLGPTCDDLTKMLLAKSFGLELKMDEDEKAGLYDYLTNKGYSREMTENNLQQALLPEGCTKFHNNWGTAPGCAFEKDGKICVMLPGPPREMNSMFRACVMPYLKKLSDEEIISHEIRVFGTSESAMDYMLRDYMNSLTNPTMAPYAKEADCLLRVTAKARTAGEAEAMMKPVMDKAISILGDTVYGVDVNCLEERVFQILNEKKLTFASAESCTGGDIARRFTEIPGASEFFVGGAVTYTDEMKAKLLGVDPELIKAKTAVSHEVAAAMAEGIRKISGADMAVSTTGIAGPDTDGIHKVGCVFVGLATKDGTFVMDLQLGEHRNRPYIRRAAGNFAFDMMRRYMTGLPMMDIKQ